MQQEKARLERRQREGDLNSSSFFQITFNIWLNFFFFSFVCTFLIFIIEVFGLSAPICAIIKHISFYHCKSGYMPIIEIYICINIIYGLKRF